MIPPIFALHIQGTLLFAWNHLSCLLPQDSHLLWCSVPGDLGSAGEDVPRHHIPPMFPWKVRDALCRFQSPLLTASRLISFPPPTKMFQFGGFPFPKERPPKRPRFALGDPGFYGCMRLARAYRSLPRPSSASKA